MSFIYSFLAADSALLHLAKQGAPRDFGSRELRHGTGSAAPVVRNGGWRVQFCRTTINDISNLWHDGSWAKHHRSSGRSLFAAVSQINSSTAQPQTKVHSTSGLTSRGLSCRVRAEGT